MNHDDTPIETSEREARPWKPSDGYLPAGGDDEHPAVKERSAAEAMRMALEALEYHTAQTRPIDRTEAAISALREAIERDGWRPISEAPTDGTQVLATWAHTWTRNAPHIEVCETGEKGDWFYSYDGDSPAKPPTHWRPLPDAPKD